MTYAEIVLSVIFAIAIIYSVVRVSSLKIFRGTSSDQDQMEESLSMPTAPHAKVAGK